MKKAGALASALRDSGASLPATHAEHPVSVETSPAAPSRQPSRRETKAITVHFPEEVRRQLKAMAGEQGRNADDLVAEALNMLFVKYRRPELAPRKVSK